MNADAIDRDIAADAIEARLGSHVEGIVSAARRAAGELQAEVEGAANERAAQIESAAARRAHAVRMCAEAEAEQLVARAQAASQQYVAASRRLVDEFARERMTRIAEVGDKLAAHAEALLEPLARSEELARQLLDLRDALGSASERIAAEAGREDPQLPELALPAMPSPSSAPTPSLVPSPDDAAGDAPADTPASLEQRLARATGQQRNRVAPAPEPMPDGELEVPDAG